MRDAHNNDSAGAWAVFILALVLFVSLLGNAYQFLQPKGRVRCSDFGSYSDAHTAYVNGASWLDGYPKDGIPCNSLYKKSL